MVVIPGQANNDPAQIEDCDQRFIAEKLVEEEGLVETEVDGELPFMRLLSVQLAFLIPLLL